MTTADQNEMQRRSGVPTSDWLSKFPNGAATNVAAMERKIGVREEKWLMESTDIAPLAGPLMLISIGESNSGGAAANATSLFSWENDARPELPIWLVDSPFGFVPLDIGTNNNLGHGGLDETTHGWELGLANHARINSFGLEDAYYVQTGAGGSLLAWHVPGHFSGAWEQFETRVAAAKAAVSTTRYILLISIGINDAQAGSPLSEAAYKAALQSRIAAWRGETSDDALILLCHLPDFYDSTGYSTAIDEIAAADPTHIKVIPVSGVPISSDHFTDDGYRQLAHRFTRHINSYFDLDGSGLLTWSDFADDSGPFLKIPDSAPQHSHASEVIDLTQAFSLVQEYDPDGGLVVVVLDEDVSEVDWNAAADDYLLGWFVNGDIYVATGSGVTVHNEAISGAHWLRCRKSGNDLILEKSTNGGTSYTTIYTRSGILSGKTTGRVKVLTVSGSAQFTLIWRE